jgi:hypothetical protein
LHNARGLVKENEIHFQNQGVIPPETSGSGILFGKDSGQAGMTEKGTLQTSFI